MSKILITGASGLVGTRLTELLEGAGHQVVHLGRAKKTGARPVFTWDIEKGVIDEEAFAGVNAIVHLAGAGVADKPWTPKRKLEILESRTKSTALLAKYMKHQPQIKTVVSASAIGYYGFGLSDHEFTEASNPGTDFLAQVVRAWEEEVNGIENKRIVKLRIGIVLSEKGGALKEMAKPIKMFVGAPLGTGKQLMSWIHIDDLCGMFIKAVEDETMNGVYNATGPYAVTNKELTQQMAKALHRPLLLPPIPSFVLITLLGEMANLVLYGLNVSSTKIQKAGFTFSYPTLELVIANLLGKRA
jgi:uncharacterized protein (TIGR01777 family)